MTNHRNCNHTHTSLADLRDCMATQRALFVQNVVEVVVFFFLVFAIGMWGC